MSVEDIVAIANKELMQDYEKRLEVYELKLCYEQCVALRLRVAVHDAKNKKDYKEYHCKLLEWANQVEVVDRAHAKCIAQKKLIQIHEKNMNSQ